MAELPRITEQFVTHRGEPLRLSFEPEAIRSHFAGCGSHGERLAALSDATLAEIGLMALTSDEMETTFNSALREACMELEGFDPEGDPTTEHR